MASAAAAPPVAAPQRKPAIDTDEALIFGGGALALLALAGAGIAMTRRRRNHVEEAEYDVSPEASEDVIEPVSVPQPTPASEPQPAILAPPISAFNWGRPTRTAAPKRNESWVERAYRGPTPENPSLSLRKRLKRAAFFDKREREAAASIAPKVDADAGLPENINAREFEAA